VSEEEDNSKRYWIALAVDNSIPRPEPDPVTGFLPMYFNASPLLSPTDEGDDALCVFSTEGEAIAYLRQTEEQVYITPAMQMPVLAQREAFQDVFVHWPTSYIVIDPEYGASEDRSIPVDEFLAYLEE
jgi:hypothetical protein